MASTSPINSQQAGEPEARQRILDAAFALFTSRGYVETNTLDIATLAKVSKRDLYALVGKKEDMLNTCITDRATRLRWPQDIPSPHNHESLAAGLERFGYQLLLEVTDPIVVSVFRLAISEARRAPEVARTLDNIGRATSRDALRILFAHAKATGLVEGDVADMVERFLALLWGDLLMRLLLDIAERPDEQALKRRAKRATEAFMRLYASSDAE